MIKLDDVLNKKNEHLIEFIDENVLIDKDLLESLFEKVKNNIRYGDIKWPSNLAKNDEQCKKLIKQIEKQLIKNNNEFTRFPNDYILGLICLDVTTRKDIKINDKPFDDKNWKIIQIYNYPSDNKNPIYSSAIYQNEFKNQLVLANKSIEASFKSIFNENGSLNTNIDGLLLNEYVPQLAKCYEITELVYKMAKENKCSLTFTGYCNGAWLSEHGIYWCERELKKLTYYLNDNFDVKTKAVLFESPGITKDENDFKSNIISSECDFNLDDLNIVNYLTAPNLINSSNKHIGIVYRLFIDQFDKQDLSSIDILDKFEKVPIVGTKISNVFKKSRFLYNGLMIMFYNTNLKIIIDKSFELDTESGKYLIKNCVQMLDWPLIEIEFNKNYKENFEKVIKTPIEKLISYIPFSDSLKVISEPVKWLSTKILSTLTNSLTQKVSPGLHILFNFLIEIIKDENSIDLTYFDNELFFKNLIEIESININDKYISDVYESKMGKKKFEFKKSIQKLIESFNYSTTARKKEINKVNDLKKNLEKKYKLKFVCNYRPIERVDYFKLMNISDEYTKNIDWFLFNLKQINLDSTQFKQSKIITKQLKELKLMYDIIEIEKNDQLKHYICSLKQDKIINTIETIKEKFIRLKMINPEYIKNKFNKNNDSIRVKKLLIDYNLDQEINFIGRKNELDQIKIYLKESRRVLITSDMPGTGKTTLANEYAHRNKHKMIVRKFNSSDNDSIKSDYEFFAHLLLGIEIKILRKNFKENELIQIVNTELKKLQNKFLFIFDNVDDFNLLEKYIKNLKNIKNIFILVTSRQINKNYEGSIIMLKYFNYEEANRFIEVNLENELSEDEKLCLINELKRDENFSPLWLNICIKYINENYIEKASKLIKNIEKDNLKQMIYILMRNASKKSKNLLKNLAFLYPDQINFTILKWFCRKKNDLVIEIVELLTSLERNGLIQINKQKKFIKIHREIQFEIRRYLREIKRDKFINIRKNVCDILLEHIENLNENEYNNDKENQYINLKHFVINFILLNENDKNEILIDNEIKSIEYIIKYSQYQIDFNEELKYKLLLLEKQKIFYGNLDHPNIADSLNNIGSSYSILGQYEKALENSLKSYEMRSRIYGNIDHHDLAQSLNFIGTIYCNLGKYEIALNNYLKSYEIRKRIYGDLDHIDLTKSLDNFGYSYTYMGQYEKALEEYLKSYEMKKRIYGEIDHKDLAISLNCIGNTYSYLGQYKKAIEIHFKSYEMKKRIYGDLDHPELAISLNNIAFIYSKLGKYENALEYNLKSFEMNKKVYGEIDHPYLATSLNNIGLTYSKLGQYEKSLEYYLKSFEIDKRIYGDIDHPVLAISYNNMGIIYGDLGQYIKSLESHLKAFEIRKRIYGDNDHPDVALSYNNIGLTYSNLGQNEKAIENYLKSFEMYKRINGNNDQPVLALLLNNIGCKYSDLGKYEMALESHFKSYEMRRRIYDENDHPNLAQSLNNIAYTYANMSQYEKALENHFKSYEMKKRIYGDLDHPDLARSLYNIGYTYANMGQYETGLENCLKSYEMRKRIYGDIQHPVLTMSMNTIASIRMKINSSNPNNNQ